MIQIDKLFQQNPQAISINLENIRDLTLCVRKLEKFPNLRILSLHGNLLKFLPLMSQLKLMTLDVSNNPLQINNYLLDSLFSLATLQNLIIDANEEQTKRILQNLPNLKTLNKKKVVRQKFTDKKNDLSDRMKDSLRREKQKIKEMARTILQKFDYFQSETLNTFDINFNQIFEQYRAFSDNVSIDTAKQGVFIYSKYKILDILQQKIANSLSQNKLGYVAAIFQQMAVVRKQYFDSLLRIVLQVGYNEACLEDDLGDEINMEMKSIKLRKERLYLKQIMRLKKKINDYRTYLLKLQEQNKRYLQTFYSLTRNQSQNFNIQPLKTPTNKPLDIFPHLMNRQRNQNQKPAQNRTSLTPSKSSQKLRDQQLTPRKKSNQKMNRQASKITLLSQDQTIDLMEEIIAEKHAHNEKAKKKKQCYETAEQFLSTHFTSKYGVKTIAINWSLNLIRSLQYYAKDNSLCEVFLKILKNTIEQSFYQQHVQFIQNLRNEILQLGQQQNISQGEAQTLFLRFFPTEDLDQFKIINNINNLTVQTLFKQLCKTQVKTHQSMLAEFSDIFKKCDTNQDGALTFDQAKEFVTIFFKPKIEKGIVTSSVIEKAAKKLDNLKKNKLIFSELVQIIDKIH